VTAGRCVNTRTSRGTHQVPLLIIGAVLTIASVVISYYLTDRATLRKIVLGVGLAGAALSFIQGYRNVERAGALQNKLTTVDAEEKHLECLQSEMTRRHFSPEQRARLVSKLAAFPGTVVNTWMFVGGPGSERVLSFEEEKTFFALTLTDVFRAAKWKTNGVTERRNYFPDMYESIAVAQREGSDGRAIKALLGELDSDCIAAFAFTFTFTFTFTDNGDFGQKVIVDNAGQHLDTSHTDITGAQPLKNPDISIMVGDALKSR
jgi:hypothetical protein